MSIVAIVASAGKGKRLKGRVKKPFLVLGAKPVLARTLSALESSRFVDEVILLVDKNDLKRAEALVKKFRLKKVKHIMQGGSKRSDSVSNGLKAVGGADIILVHDGARPFLSQSLIKRCIQAARRHGASCACVPVTSTVKKVARNGIIHSTPERSQYYFAQTPQVFKASLLKKAYENYKRNKTAATDDSSLVERLGIKVKMVLGDYRNIKITTPEDLAVAKAILKSSQG